MRYSSNNPDSIKNLFDVEGESLGRAGFTMPDLSHMPEERTTKRGKTMAELDPTGTGEYGDDALRYTQRNSRAVETWRQQEAAGELGRVTTRKAFD